jgi:hypothetical protein
LPNIGSLDSSNLQNLHEFLVEVAGVHASFVDPLFIQFTKMMHSKKIQWKKVGFDGLVSFVRNPPRGMEVGKIENGAISLIIQAFEFPYELRGHVFKTVADLVCQKSKTMHRSSIKRIVDAITTRFELYFGHDTSDTVFQMEKMYDRVGDQGMLHSSQ